MTSGSHVMNCSASAVKLNAADLFIVKGLFRGLFQTMHHNNLR